jgi:hypothetical protein
MSENLNKTLGQIEEDLKKLQSAREQVENVVASNQEFAAVVNSLVENTNLLVDKIGTTIEGAIKDFSEKLTESKNATDKVVENSISHIQSSVKKIEEANLKLQDTIETKVNEVSQLANNAIDANVAQSLSFVDKMKTSTEEAIELFSEKLTESKNEIDKVVENSITHIQSSVKKMEEANLKLQDTIETTINEVSQLAGNTIDTNATQSLATIKDTSNLAIKSLEEQKNENLKTLNQILETHNQIKQLIGQLFAFDLPNTLKSLNSNIEKQQQQSNKQFQAMHKMQIWSLIGIGVLAAIIIVFGIVL